MIRFLAALALASRSCLAAPSPSLSEIGAVLNDWHDAAAKADAKRYFSHLDDEAVFLGTDPGERWTKSEFEAYAKPFFDKGKGWTLIPSERRVFFSADGNTAWFDEKVDSPKYGRNRGTGVLVKVRGVWKVAQYNYSLPIPNALFPRVVEMIKTPPKTK